MLGYHEYRREREKMMNRIDYLTVGAGLYGATMAGSWRMLERPWR